MSADRASGTFFLVLGLVMYFWVIPNFAEDVKGANLAPDTVPNGISLVIAFCGALLAFKPTDFLVQHPRAFFITGAYAVLLGAGIYAMSWFGFEVVAPILAFIIMWMIGERRPLWLGAGTFVMPLIIWFLVTYPLGRALP